MIPGGFPLAEMQVATGVFKFDERATRVGVDKLICVVGRTKDINKCIGTYYNSIILHLQSVNDIFSPSQRYITNH